MFEVLIVNAQLVGKTEVVYEGKNSSVFLPGADGEFEILDFHKPIISRLKKGTIVVDNYKEFPVTGGIVKMQHQKLIAMVSL